MITLPDIRTAVTEREAMELERLATGKRVLEIGSQFGFSTVVMARVATQVVAIDHHKGDELSGYGDTLDDFRDHLAFHGVADKVVPMLGDWRIALPLLNLSQFYFAFFDAEHDAESIVGFLMRYRNLIGGPVAIHDYGRFGVKEGVERATIPMRNAGWKGELQVVDTLAVLT